MNIWTKLAMFSFLKRSACICVLSFLVTVKRFSRLLQTLRIYSLFFPVKQVWRKQYALANYFMKNPLGVWAICLQGNQEMIGSIKFEKIDEIKKEAEIGYFLKRILGHKFYDRSGYKALSAFL